MHLICTQEPQGSPIDLKDKIQIMYLLNCELPLETQQGGDCPAVSRDTPHTQFKGTQTFFKAKLYISVEQLKVCIALIPKA